MHSLLSFACVFVTIVASATEVKRGYGCSSEITQSPYTTSDGTTFDLQCNTSYTNTQFLDITYTTNFSSCMEACVKWDEAVPCVGVQWDHETLSYQGNNYLCYLLWDMSGNSTEEDQIDSAKIRTASPVFPPLHADCRKTIVQHWAPHTLHLPGPDLMSFAIENSIFTTFICHTR